ncbi:MAG TPA: MgtC/SapB family protein [Candidatus Paceibacterota bacterium]|nr:MgtC/SapB family protein [Candidatus Paceibacterota bacterium]
MSPLEMQFLVGLGVSIVIGLVIGVERESRNKDAGISTHILVIAGAMLFTQLSAIVDPASTSRIASQIIPGIGFLGAGLILKEGGNVRNLTTAASLWFSAAIGMAIGFGFITIAAIAGIACALIPRIPSVHKHPIEG